MKFRGRSLLRLWFITSLSCSSHLFAGPITIGFITFDTGAPIAGENEVSVNDFTGLTYGCSIPNGTPVCDNLNLTSIILTVNYLDSLNQAQQTVLNVSGAIGPGTTVPSNFIFPGTENITSLIFAATITPTSFHLTDNSVFQAGPTVSSAPLTPGSNTLSLLTVAAPVSSVPEPGTLGFIASSLLLAVLTGRQRSP
jgi:hypothetical protein